MRHEGQWILIEGPFEPVKNANSSANSSEISVFWPDFYELEGKPLFQGTVTYELKSSDIQQICESYLRANAVSDGPQSKILGKAPWREPLQEHFATALISMLAKIKDGEIQKAVPAVFARTAQTVSPHDLAQMIFNLSKAPETLHVYGFWQNGEGVLGATPEVLFDFDFGILKTMALAGTCPKSESTERESLLKDPKEMQEHGLVVEDLKSRLAKWGSVKTEGPKILELPTLFHLKTDFVVKCHATPNFRKLTEELHPTPALGVAPRSAGYKWMAEYPGQEGRRGFGGPFAFFDQNKALCLVGIRNLQWNSEEAMIGSGCGVVAASELDREWRELFQKRLSVKKILGLEL
ncbi:chorismate-binding protein [Bdellovibrio svalbardensis]|uniref:Chorismate-binding protein n=1 Tax=Bdellovibrio svalbardensis TaxID=2972972 RepID=A0ABT6DEL1_9BACT|nr:chorismate-binding protein [Bdellovibrio svalbardensis]MDG0815280.1 chorismate-binding protein [Bdellovibrio svalbardensis]